MSNLPADGPAPRQQSRPPARVRPRARTLRRRPAVPALRRQHEVRRLGEPKVVRPASERTPAFQAAELPGRKIDLACGIGHADRRRDPPPRRSTATQWIMRFPGLAPISRTKCPRRRRRGSCYTAAYAQGIRDAQTLDRSEPHRRAHGIGHRFGRWHGPGTAKLGATERPQPHPGRPAGTFADDAADARCCGGTRRPAGSA